MDLAVWTSRCRQAVLLLEDLGVLFLRVEVSAGSAPSGGPGGALPRGRGVGGLFSFWRTWGRSS